MHDARPAAPPIIEAIDLFCGAGGLSYGLKQAGVRVVAGIDVDPLCRHPFSANVKSEFLERDVRSLDAAELDARWTPGAIRLLAGCAPCQPFSMHRRGADTSNEDQWSLLDVFADLVEGCQPDLVTMENVPRLGSSDVFRRFVDVLTDGGYDVDWRSEDLAVYGLPQRRRRMVLVASRLGPIAVPDGWRVRPRTVGQAIGALPPLRSGQVDAQDAVHACRDLTDVNLRRLRASAPGGTWEDWPEELRADCHRRSSGSTFRNVYARMRDDEAAPTITTMAHNFGAGRFGHPTQDRTISLREAAVLQGFPPSYEFVPADQRPSFLHTGRLIGNAVPPPLGRALGRTMTAHAFVFA